MSKNLRHAWGWPNLALENKAVDENVFKHIIGLTVRRSYGSAGTPHVKAHIFLIARALGMSRDDPT
eukprot:5209837-Karenia_brevis.AAC.1